MYHLTLSLDLRSLDWIALLKLYTQTVTKDNNIRQEELSKSPYLKIVPIPVISPRSGDADLNKCPKCHGTKEGLTAKKNGHFRGGLSMDLLDTTIAQTQVTIQQSNLGLLTQASHQGKRAGIRLHSYTSEV